MKRSRIWLAAFSILVGGFLFASFFVNQPVIQAIGAETFLWIERLMAALLFFTIADSAIAQVRKAGNDGGMRVIRIVGFGVFLAVLILGLIKGPESTELNRVVSTIQKTFESALAGLVCLSLIFAAFRLPSQAPSVLKASFFAGMVIFLFIFSGLPQMLVNSEPLQNILEWIECIPRGAIMGLLTGIAIGGAITGLRFIFSGKLPSKEDK